MQRHSKDLYLPCTPQITHNLPITVLDGSSWPCFWRTAAIPLLVSLSLAIAIFASSDGEVAGWLKSEEYSLSDKY